MINISERAKQHLFRFALGLGVTVLILTFFAVMPWFIIKGMIFIVMAGLLYVLGFVILEAFNDIKHLKEMQKEMQRVEDEIKVKKDKQ